MIGKHMEVNDWLTAFGLMMAAPVLLLLGVFVVIALSTPILMVVIVIAFATAVLFVGTLLTRQTSISDATGKEDDMCDSVDLFAALGSGNVEMLEALTDAPKTPVSATITKVVGPCPLDLMPGNTWEISPDGSLSRPMCRAGATALSALFRMAHDDVLDDVPGDVIQRSACCECVIAGREVTFTVREPVEAPA